MAALGSPPQGYVPDLTSGWRYVPLRFRECVTVFGNLFIIRCRPLIVAIGTAGETACPTLLYKPGTWVTL